MFMRTMEVPEFPHYSAAAIHLLGLPDSPAVLVQGSSLLDDGQDQPDQADEPNQSSPLAHFRSLMQAQHRPRERRHQYSRRA